ncbi:MAG TPA: transglutaminase family protein [Candidatus Dormibacteraeota bacterium]|nr:transglutaminase family protein [Candidatus Dormibacteraeota bacterium]
MASTFPIGAGRQYEIVHDSIHHYERSATRSRNEVRLQPLPRKGVQLETFRLEVTPAAEMDAQIDHFGNPTWLVSVEAPHSELRVTARSQVSITPGERASTAAVPWDPDQLVRSPAVEFQLPSPRVPELMGIKALAGEMNLAEGDWDSLLRANRDLRLRFEYLPGSTVVSSTLQEILERRVGVCQDFAHVLIALARYLGWPARYVSGYVVPEAESEGNSHAWVEIGSADGSWLGLDPTHKSETSEWHVAVAVGRDYSDVSPMRGVFVSESAGAPPEVSVRIAAVDPFELRKQLHATRQILQNQQ